MHSKKKVLMTLVPENQAGLFLFYQIMICYEKLNLSTATKVHVLMRHVPEFIAKHQKPLRHFCEQFVEQGHKWMMYKISNWWHHISSLLCTASNFLMCFFRWGDHIACPYSILDLTIAVYRGRNTSFSRYLKFLLIILIIWLALLTKLLTWSSKLKFFYQLLYLNPYVVWLFLGTLFRCRYIQDKVLFLDLAFFNVGTVSCTCLGGTLKASCCSISGECLSIV